MLTLSNFAWAGEGQDLYQTQCIECHGKMTGGDGSLLYKRDDRIAVSMHALEDRVKHCAKGANANWNSAQIKAVTEFLNNSFYQY